MVYVFLLVHVITIHTGFIVNLLENRAQSKLHEDEGAGT